MIHPAVFLCKNGKIKHYKLINQSKVINTLKYKIVNGRKKYSQVNQRGVFANRNDENTPP